MQGRVGSDFWFEAEVVELHSNKFEGIEYKSARLKSLETVVLPWQKKYPPIVSEGQELHSNETRSAWWPVGGIDRATAMREPLAIGDKVFVQYIYAGYYAPLKKLRFFGNWAGNGMRLGYMEWADENGVEKDDVRFRHRNDV